MKNVKIKLAVTAITSAAVMLGGVSAVSAADLELAGRQPSVVSEFGGETDGVYIVRLEGDPVATYRGGVRGLAPTNPAANGRTRLSGNSSAVRGYEQHLKKQQSDVLKHAAGVFKRSVTPIHDYQYAFNGFAVEMTVEEAKAMRTLEGVASVQKERVEQLLTDAGPAWIGAPQIWTNPPNSTKGEGAVIAILDTGINSDHPSYFWLVWTRVEKK
jgi:hypothetical protein